MDTDEPVHNSRLRGDCGDLAALERGTTEKIPLKEAETEFTQGLEFGALFHALSDGTTTEIVSDFHYVAHDHLARLVPLDISDQFHVDLEVIGLEFRKEFESGVTGAKVVDRRHETATLVLFQNAHDMRMSVDALALDDFQANPPGRQPMTLGRSEWRQLAGS